jgi:uncharacterized membrane protein YhaH (DUF805 family)
MSFGQAVSSGFSKYAQFSGRARRSEYWFWALFVFLVYVVALVADGALGSSFNDSSPAGWVTLVVALLLAIPSLAMTFRRLHDTDRSGWWWLLTLICFIGAVIVLVFCLMDSTPGANRYGPSPKVA